MRKPTERYIGWYGMRMLTASRDRTECQMNRKCSNEVNRWMSSVPNTDTVMMPQSDTVVDVNTQSDTAADMMPQSDTVVDVNTQSPQSSTFDVVLEVASSRSGLRNSLSTVEKIYSACRQLGDVIDDSGSEYIPSDKERVPRCCNICKEEVFIACPLCHKLLCFDHRLTECSQHMHVPAVNEQHVPAARKKRNTTRREQKNSRKRMRQENKWHRVQSKNNREKGFSYTSYNGNVVPAKSVCSSKILCREKCKRKCSEKIDMSHRQHIFDSFYALDTNSKNCYLFKSIKPIKPQVQRMQAKKHREMSFHYEVVVNGETIIVCKKAFETLHQITSMKIYHLTEQIKTGAPAPHPCHRGKHSSRPNRLSCDDIECVMEHVNMFPAKSSHYSRSANSSRLYLSSALSISKMYSLYVEWCADKNVDPVSKRGYHDVFVTKFNLGFGSPRSDTCSTCDLGVNNEEHKLRAQRAFRQQQIDRDAAKETNGLVFITFDLEKSLPLPKISTGVAFYLRQLWLCNFGIHMTSLQSCRPYFSIWTENQAGRGCEEIASSLLAVIEDTRLATLPSHQLV